MSLKKLKIFEVRKGESKTDGSEYLYLHANVGSTQYNLKSITVETQDGNLIKIDQKTPLYLNDVRDKIRHVTENEEEANAKIAKIPKFILDEAVLTLR